MDKNLDLYNKVRSVPDNAQSEIKGGRLAGKTDINPMWRIKTLTENFGACGFGWRYEIIDKRLEKGANDEVAAFVDINLYIKINGEWSEPIQGTGGSMFVAKEKNGLYTSDECFKMALTDAISVACKALGVGADIYWNKDKTKYSNTTSEPLMTQTQRNALIELGVNLEDLARYYKTDVNLITQSQAQEAIALKQRALRQKAANNG
jgi:hypothetical protein